MTESNRKAATPPFPPAEHSAACWSSPGDIASAPGSNNPYG